VRLHICHARQHRGIFPREYDSLALIPSKH
jgi:hypothetical protein